MTTTIIHKRRAVSPVIATVILIAVAVALGIAVAFWASGLTSSFSKYEKLGVNTQYAIAASGTSCAGGKGSCWSVVLGGQNTGSSDATITQIQINGVPYPITSSIVVTGSNHFALPPPNSGTAELMWNSSAGAGSTTLSVNSGGSFNVQLFLNATNTITGKTFTSGQTIQVVLITAAGNNYPASIVLP